MNSVEYPLSPKWVKLKLEELQSKGVKLGKPRKFSNLDWRIQASTLRIAENIGVLIGFENVTIEPSLSKGDADIKFVDGQPYFLQIKTPRFFSSKYASKFDYAMKNFLEILSRSRSRFSVAYATNSSLELVKVKEVIKPGRSVSLGLLIFDWSFVPIRDIRLQIDTLLNYASNQLGRIEEKGWKIFVLDVSQYSPRGNFDYYKTLREVFLQNRKFFSEIDGIGLFSLNLEKEKGARVPPTIIPVWFKEEITSIVFKQPCSLYSGRMFAIVSKAQCSKGWNELLEINKEGYICVDGVEYGPYWKYINI